MGQQREKQVFWACFSLCKNTAKNRKRQKKFWLKYKKENGKEYKSMCNFKIFPHWL